MLCGLCREGHENRPSPGGDSGLASSLGPALRWNFMSTSSRSAVHAGIRLEVATVVWMALEAILAIGAGVAAHSVLLITFGLDSVIELVSGLTLLWRLSVEWRGLDPQRVQRTEARATRISAVLLVLLSAWVFGVGLAGVLTRTEPDSSALGVGVAAAAVLVMPILAWQKQRANCRIGSPSLSADIAETLTCAYMAAATLVGVALNLSLGWWWAEYVAVLVLLAFVTHEALETIAAVNGT